MGEPPGIDQACDVEQQFLRTPEGEHRNYEVAGTSSRRLRTLIGLKCDAEA